MTDFRPAHCRFRLQDEGKTYHRSACSACGRTITTGLGVECSADKARVEAIEKVARLGTADEQLQMLAKIFEAKTPGEPPLVIYAAPPHDDPNWESGSGEWDVSDNWAQDNKVSYTRSRSLLSELAEATRQRDVFRAVLEGAGYGNLDATAKNTVDQSLALGQIVRKLTDQLAVKAAVATILLAELYEAADWGYGTEQITREEAEAWWPIRDRVKAFLDAQKPKQEEKTK